MREVMLDSGGGVRLRLALFSPAGPALGSVLITPGYGEHIGRYEHVARLWNQRGLLVAAYDPRGQGLSHGERGHVTAFEQFEDDLLGAAAWLGEIPEWSRLGPPVAFGHSLGALISTRVALRAPDRFRALVLSSPYFGLALDTPRYKLALARTVSCWWPTYRDKTGIRGAQLTRDGARAHLLDSDPLRLTTVTARWFTEVEEAQASLRRWASSLQLPIFCVAAGADSIAALEATRRCLSEAGSRDKELVVLDDVFHELHQEFGWEQTMQLFAEHILRYFAHGSG